MKKLECRLSVEAYAKNIREKVSKCSLKFTAVLLDTDGYMLTLFDIYQGTVGPNYFKSYTLMS